MERPIARLETTRREAPIDPDILFRELGGFACTEITDCRQRKQDTNFHHANFPRSEFTDDIGHSFRAHPDQVIEMCVCKHEQVHKTWQRSERPSDDYMAGWLMGQGHLTERARKAIKEFRRNRGGKGQVARNPS